MNAKEARKLAIIALAACPDRASFLDGDAVEAMGAAWEMLLEDIAYTDGQAALKRFLAANPGKLPAPGHIRAIVAESTHGRRRAGGDAWGDVAAMRRPTIARRGYGVNDPPPAGAFADPLVAICVERLGWRELGNAAEDDPAPRSQFVRLYDSLAEGAAEDRAVASLPGVARPALPGGAASLVGEVADRLRLVGGGRK